MKILQIVNAEKWIAVFGNEQKPVACWALVEIDNENRVFGMIEGECGLAIANESQDFRKYIKAV